MLSLSYRGENKRLFIFLKFAYTKKKKERKKGKEKKQEKINQKLNQWK